MLAITSTYYGVFMAVTSGVIAVCYLAVTRRAWTRQLLIGAVVGGVCFAAIAGPVALQYSKLQEDSYFRRDYVPTFSLIPGDLRIVNPENRLLGEGTVVSSDSTLRSSENYAFPGIVTLVFGAVGLVILVRRRWWTRDGRTSEGRKELIIIGIGGIAALLVAMGRYRVSGIELPFFNVAAKVVPGFEGIRVLVRFFVVTQLALSLLAGAGAAFVLALVRKEWVRWAVAAVIVVGVVAETAADSAVVHVPDTDRTGQIYEQLEGLPPGRVLELPVADTADIWWPFTEAPRMAAETDARHLA